MHESSLLMKKKITDPTLNPASTAYVDANTLLLAKFDNTLSTEVGSVVISNSGGVMSAAQSKFGTKSLYFNGAAEVLISSAPVIGAGDFTVEFWAYLISTSQGDMIYHTTVYPRLRWFNSGIGLYDATNSTNSTPLAAPVLSAWAHYAMVRSGNTEYLYANGIFKNSIVNANNYTGTSFYMGHTSGFSYYNTMYVNALRISNVARYTSNFTPVL